MAERQVKQIGAFGERPGNKAAANAPASCCGKFALQPTRIAITAADKPKAARCGHRGGNPTPAQAPQQVLGIQTTCGDPTMSLGMLPSREKTNQYAVAFLNNHLPVRRPAARRKRRSAPA